jgi:hypothetical protein
VIEQAGQADAKGVQAALLAAQLGFGEIDEIGRTVPQHQAVGRELSG